jgi:hypothetical protein
MTNGESALSTDGCVYMRDTTRGLRFVRTAESLVRLDWAGESPSEELLDAPGRDSASLSRADVGVDRIDVPGATVGECLQAVRTGSPASKS